MEYHWNYRMSHITTWLSSAICRINTISTVKRISTNSHRTIMGSWDCRGCTYSHRILTAADGESLFPVSKLLKGVDFGLQPVVSIIEALPEINARWFLTGQGEMLSDEKQADLRREALEHVYQVMELERFIPVMTPDELRMFERQVREGEKADFSPDTIQSWRERLNVREREINVKFATAAAKSDELCRQKTAKR